MYAIYDPSFTESIQVSVPLFCAGLFVCCWFCHGELAKRRPAASHLTSFYLMISLGGALGANVCRALRAPHFPGDLRIPTGAGADDGVSRPMVLWSFGWQERVFWTAATIIMAVILVRSAHSYKQDTILMVRNFYGALRVKQAQDWLKQPYHTLYHGKIEHGAQFLNPPKSLLPDDLLRSRLRRRDRPGSLLRLTETCRRDRSRRGHSGGLRQGRRFLPLL